MKRLILQYNFSGSENIHLAGLFPDFKRTIIRFNARSKYNRLNKNVSGYKRPAVNFIPAGLFLKGKTINKKQ